MRRCQSTRGGPPGEGIDAGQAERGQGGRGQGGRGVLSLSMDTVDADAWPLIGFLMEDAEYSRRYVELVTELSSSVFTPQRMIPVYEQNFAMLAAFVIESEGEDAVAALRAATDDLVTHVNQRAAAAEAFLAGNGSE